MLILFLLFLFLILVLLLLLVLFLLLFFLFLFLLFLFRFFPQSFEFLPEFRPVSRFRIELAAETNGRERVSNWPVGNRLLAGLKF